MPSSCKDIRQELVDCLLKSDCVMKHGIKPSECMDPQNAPLVPNECHHLRRSYYECRRGMIDMRKRFRGNNSGSVAAATMAEREQKDAELASESR